MEESFVYCWTDHIKNMKYIGYHKGSPDDGYVCSSNPMTLEYEKRPEDFTRKVLRSGPAKDMYIFETWILGAVDARNNPEYYNMHNNEAPFWNQGSEKYSLALSMGLKRRWSSEAARIEQGEKAKNGWADPEVRSRRMMGIKKHCDNPVVRAHRSAIAKSSPKSILQRERNHSDPSRIAKHAAAMARTYRVRWPDGKQEVVTNMREFCRTHELNAGNMIQVSKGRYAHSKGLKVIKVETL
jgi:hypothetical protein